MESVCCIDHKTLYYNKKKIFQGNINNVICSNIAIYVYEKPYLYYCDIFSFEWKLLEFCFNETSLIKKIVCGSLWRLCVYFENKQLYFFNSLMRPQFVAYDEIKQITPIKDKCFYFYSDAVYMCDPLITRKYLIAPDLMLNTQGNLIYQDYSGLHYILFNSKYSRTGLCKHSFLLNFKQITDFSDIHKLKKIKQVSYKYFTLLTDATDTVSQSETTSFVTELITVLLCLKFIDIKIPKCLWVYLNKQFNFL